MVFGDLAATLHIPTVAPTSYGIYVSQHRAPAYALQGAGMSQAAFVAFGVALVKVPKPGA